MKVSHPAMLRQPVANGFCRMLDKIAVTRDSKGNQPFNIEIVLTLVVVPLMQARMIAVVRIGF